MSFNFFFNIFINATNSRFIIPPTNNPVNDNPVNMQNMDNKHASKQTSISCQLAIILQSTSYSVEVEYMFRE